MEGTIRTFDEGQRDEIHAHIQKISEMIAAAGGAQAKVMIKRGYDVTVNDPALMEWSLPTIRRIAGDGNVGVVDKVCGAEDFAFYQKVVPGVFLRLGCRPAGVALKDSAPNHSPRFFVDERCLTLGVRTLSALALDWLAQG
jgi:amidohydrolase